MRTILVACIFLVGMSAYAHHSMTGFDRAKNVALTGTIKQFKWANPHSWIDIEVPNDKGGSDLPGAADLDATIPRDRVPKNLHYVCMTRYDKNFGLPVVIPPESMANILANVMGGLNMRNLRVAETEK